jgi:prepilin-type N-terminal cleavage/methylation domain-containing protein
MSRFFNEKFSLSHEPAGFTLIELLIVVAIIAILAAIAVPNFLEAQVRAKNVQQLANERSIITASEAYRVDNNALPATARHWYNPKTTDGYWVNRYGFWIALTTPVAYMTSVPEDLYYKLACNTWDGWRGIYANYYEWDFNIARAIINNTGSAPGMWDPVVSSTAAKSWLKNYCIPAMKNNGKPDTMNWCIYGLGPNYMGEGLQGGFTYTVPYDPTNGTMSLGEIFSFN